jgi:hypothetical protein
MAGEGEPQREWHRVFGMVLMDFFTDSPFAVDVERDLSQQQQFLDVLIVRRRRGRWTIRLPDGLEGLRLHNLLSFKSYQEALDAWTMRELIGHYVAYRKLVSPSTSKLLPEDQFQLYAVCARSPHNLANQVPWQKVQEGVYNCQWGLDTVRVIVAGELPQEAHNALLHLFSASRQLVSFGQGVYQPRSPQTSLLVKQILAMYGGELGMSFTWKDFERCFAKDHFVDLTPEERREAWERLSPEQRQEFIGSLSPKERVAGLQPEERVAGLRPEERLEDLSDEEIQQYLERRAAARTAAQPARPRKPRRKK